MRGGGALSHFTPAPAGDRDMVPVLLSFASKYKYEVASCDISLSFLQADELTDTEKYPALPPSCVIPIGFPLVGPCVLPPNRLVRIVSVSRFAPNAVVWIDGIAAPSAHRFVTDSTPMALLSTSG